MAKKVDAVRMKKTEILYYRMLVAVVALFAVISSIRYVDGRAEIYPVFALVLTALFGALAVASVIISAVGASRSKGKEKKAMRTFSFPFLSGLFLSLALAYASLWCGVPDSRTLIMYIALEVLLFLVFCLFDREAFCFSVYTVLGGVLLFVLRGCVSVSGKAVVSALIAAYCIASIAVTVLGKKRDIRIAKQIIYGKRFKAYPYYISVVILAAGTVMSYILLGSEIYSLAVLGCYYLIYTVVNALKNM